MESSQTKVAHYDDTVVRQFSIMAVVWGVVGMLVGVFIAAQLTWPELNFGIPWLSYGRLRPLHTNAVIFAFGGCGLFATSYYVVQRTCQTKLFGGPLIPFTFWGWQIVIVAAAISLPLGYTTSKEYAELEWPIDILIALVWVSYAIVFFGTVAQMDHGIWTVVDKYFWSWVVMVPGDLFRQLGAVFLSDWFKKDAPAWTWAFPLPGGKLLGGLMFANLIAAHLVRFRLTWKRSGVLLIHSGLLLLFVGEFITREYQVEQRMSIHEGQSVNYSEDSRKMELVFVDPSDPAVERAVAIPESLLKTATGKISDPRLPVDVEVVEYMANAKIADHGGPRNRATAGLGKAFVAVKDKEVSGTETGDKSDLPAAYVKLYDRGGAELGTYLVSLYFTLAFDKAEDVTVNGKTYQMALRNIRYYKPFDVYLEKFRFDRYPGSKMAKNFSSEVRVTDRETGAVRDQTIKMNDPLRYRGETFYQSGFQRDEKGTILQVVKNPGWVIPYISCTVVGVGMLVHFGIYLTQFLMRRAAA